MQEISFVVDGQKLHGKIFYPEKVKEKNPAILFLHGWNSSIESPSTKELPEKLSQLGFICLKFNLRSHGNSEGDRELLSRVDYLHDVVAAYDFLKEQKGVNPEMIGAIGASFGGYLATLLTEQRKIRWLSLQAPAIYPDKGFDESQAKIQSDQSGLTTWREEVLDKDATKSLRALHAYSNDMLLVESELDAFVPHQTMVNYSNAVQDKTKFTHVVMKDAPHSLREKNFVDEYTQIVTNWFKNKL